MAAQGAVGDWEGAKADYTEAAKNRAILVSEGRQPLSAAAARPGEGLTSPSAALLPPRVRVQPIARANYALALFETGDDLSAVEAARGLLRKDPEYWYAIRVLVGSLPWVSRSP